MVIRQDGSPFTRADREAVAGAFLRPSPKPVRRITPDPPRSFIERCSTPPASKAECPGSGGLCQRVANGSVKCLRCDGRWPSRYLDRTVFAAGRAPFHSPVTRPSRPAEVPPVSVDPYDLTAAQLAARLYLMGEQSSDSDREILNAAGRRLVTLADGSTA